MLAFVTVHRTPNRGTLATRPLDVIRSPRRLVSLAGAVAAENGQPNTEPSANFRTRAGALVVDVLLPDAQPPVVKVDSQRVPMLLPMEPSHNDIRSLTVQESAPAPPSASPTMT